MGTYLSDLISQIVCCIEMQESGKWAIAEDENCSNWRKEFLTLNCINFSIMFYEKINKTCPVDKLVGGFSWFIRSYSDPKIFDQHWRLDLFILPQITKIIKINPFNLDVESKDGPLIRAWKRSARNRKGICGRNLWFILVSCYSVNLYFYLMTRMWKVVPYTNKQIIIASSRADSSVKSSSAGVSTTTWCELQSWKATKILIVKKSENKVGTKVGLSAIWVKWNEIPSKDGKSQSWFWTWTK